MLRDSVWKKEFDEEFSKWLSGAFLVRAFLVYRLITADLDHVYMQLNIILDALNEKRWEQNQEIRRENIHLHSINRYADPKPFEPPLVARFYVTADWNDVK